MLEPNFVYLNKSRQAFSAIFYKADWRKLTNVKKGGQPPSLFSFLCVSRLDYCGELIGFERRAADKAAVYVNLGKKLCRVSIVH